MTDSIENLILKATEYQEEIAAPVKELAQHLSELGYLNPNQYFGFTLDVKIEEALKSFRKELAESHLFSPMVLSNYKILYHDDFELELLRLITDIDEGITIKSMPETGEVSLVTRLIHYRLDILGMFDKNPKHAFSSYSRYMLQFLKSVTGLISPIDAINAVADFELFTKQIIKKHGKENCIIVFKADQVNIEKEKFKISHAFKKKLKEDFEGKSQFYEFLKEKALARNKKHIDFEFLESHSNLNINKFLIRLIQVHQWKDGFYSGLLDSDLGPVTLESILKLTTLFNADDDEDDIRIKQILCYVGKNYYVFNALFFLKEYMIEEEKEDYPDSVIQTINNHLQHVSEKEQEKFEVNSANYLKEATKSIYEENEEVKNGLIKRIYYGIKGFFRKLFKIGKKLFRWIIEGAKKMVQFLKNFFKHILIHIKKAIEYFIQGLKFLLGKKVMITQSKDNKLILSKFSLDMDNFSIFPSHTDSQSQELHKNTVKGNVLSLKFSLTLIGKLFRIILNMVSMISWPLLLINLAKTFKEMNKEYLQLNVELKTL